MNETPYRDERATLHARIQALELELADVRGLRPRHRLGRLGVGLAIAAAAAGLAFGMLHPRHPALAPVRDARSFVVDPSHVPIVVGASVDHDGILVAMGTCAGSERHDGIAGYDAGSGEQVWSRCELVEGVRKQTRLWAVRDRVMMLVGRDLAASDGATGVVRWRRLMPWTTPVDGTKVTLCEGQDGVMFLRSGSHRVRVSADGHVETIDAFRHCTRVFRDEPWRERSAPPWQSIVDTGSAPPKPLPGSLHVRSSHAAPSVNGALVIGERASNYAVPVVALVPPSGGRGWAIEPSQRLDQDANAGPPPFAVSGQGRVVVPHRQSRDGGYRLAALDDNNGRVEWDVELSRSSGPHVVRGVALTQRSVLVMHDARIAVFDIATGTLRFELL